MTVHTQEPGGGQIELGFGQAVRLEGRLVFLPALFQLDLGLLVGRHVNDRADVAQQVAARIAQRVGAAGAPVNRAGLRHEAAIGAKRRALPDGQPPAVDDAVAILRMDRLHPAGSQSGLAIESGDRAPTIADKRVVAGRVGLKQADRGQRGQPAVERFGLAQGQLIAPARGDVLNLQDEIQRLAVDVPHQRDVELDPDDVAGSMEISLFQVVRLDLAGQQLAGQLQVGGQVVGMGERLEVGGQQLGLAVAHDARERPIGPHPAAVGGHQGHADGGMLEYAFEGNDVFCALVGGGRFARPPIRGE